MGSDDHQHGPLIQKLSNFLKLPKAQRWVCCELFYSDIDRAIFEAENDFSLCLKQSFPKLKTRMLRREQWSMIKTLIGKPRRCSDAFFQEERLVLEEKRQKIRLVQQRKLSEKDLNELKDLPQMIPISLSIGHRVYSHINQPEQGVFLGTVAAVDPIEHTYRVVFDRASIGSKTVHDFEIRSVSNIQTVPIRAYVQTFRPRLSPNSNVAPNNLAPSSLPLNQSFSQFSITPLKFSAAASALATVQSIITPSSSGIIQNTPGGGYNLLVDDLNSLTATNPSLISSIMFNSNDPMLGVSSPFVFGDSRNQTPLIPMGNNSIIPNSSAANPSAATSTAAAASEKAATVNLGGSLGGFPVRLLLMITRLSKILNVKQEHIHKLNQMNLEAERMKANNRPYSHEFQTKYAILVLDLERLNKDLSDYLLGVQRYCDEIAPDLKLLAVSANSTANNSKLDQTITLVESPAKKNCSMRDKTNQQTATSPKLNPIDSIKRDSFLEASELVERLNTEPDRQSEADKLITDSSEQPESKLKSPHILNMITRLTALLVQLKNYSNTVKSELESGRVNSSLDSAKQSYLPFCKRAFEDSIGEVKKSLSSKKNVELFEDQVQIHLIMLTRELLNGHTNASLE